MPPVRPLAPSPSEADSSTRTERPGANNGEIHMIRKRARGGTEIHGPGRRAPGMSFAAHGLSLMQGECGWWRGFRRLNGKADPSRRGGLAMTEQESGHDVSCPYTKNL